MRRLMLGLSAALLLTAPAGALTPAALRGLPEPAEAPARQAAQPQAVVVEDQVLRGSGGAMDEFGIALALDGDTALVGAYQDESGAITDAGGASVFVRSQGQWQLQARLAAPDAGSGDWFGYSVALSGNTAVVGAVLDNGPAGTDQGSAYVFVRQDGAWSLQQKLVAPEGAANDNHGIAVAIAGDTIAVGALRADVGGRPDQGVVNVWQRSGSQWTRQQQLSDPSGQSGDFFGVALALADDTLAIGAHLDDLGTEADAGSVSVFTRTAGLWTLQQKLLDPAGQSGDFAGIAVSLSGDRLVAGALGDDVATQIDQGSVRIWERLAGVWSAQPLLVAADGAAGDFFGGSVALAGPQLLVGANLRDVGNRPNQGVAYQYLRGGDGSYTELYQLQAAAGQRDAEFGWSVAVAASGRALVGARVSSGPPPGNAIGEGSVHAYDEGELATTLIVEQSPDPSLVGQPVMVTAEVSGSLSRPLDGQVSILAGSGASCTDNSPTPGAGATAARFTCSLVLQQPGLDELSARFSGSASHNSADSPPVIQEVFGPARLRIIGAQQLEGDSGTQVAEVLVTRDHALTAVSVELVDSGTGTADAEDYLPLAPQLLNFDVSGPLQQVVTLQIKGDTLGEADETVALALQNAVNATVTAEPAALLILNDDRAQVMLQASTTPPVSSLQMPVTVQLGLQVGAGASQPPTGTVLVDGPGNADCSIVLPASSCVLQPGVAGPQSWGLSYAGDAQHLPASGNVAHQVVRAADVSVGLSDGVMVATAGQQLVYQASVRNDGPDPAPGLRLRSMLGSALGPIVWTCAASGGASCPAASGSGNLDQAIGLPAGGRLDYQLQATVGSPPLPATLDSRLQVEVNAAAPDHVLDPDSTDHLALDVNVLEPLFRNGFEALPTR